MSEGLIIRRAVRADLPAIMALYQELEGAYGPVAPVTTEEAERRWQEVAGDDRQHILVAQEAGRVVGTARVIIIPNLGHHGQPWAAVDNVVVQAACRGQGIGTALLARAGDIARCAGCYKIVLSSNLVRQGAHDFYRRLGWRQTHLGFSLPCRENGFPETNG